MKTLTIYLLILVGAAQSWAQSPTSDQKDDKLQIHSSFRFRVEGDEKTDLSTNRDYMPLRIRPEIKYNYDPTLSMVLTPQFAKTFGEPTYSLSPNTGVASQQQTSGGTLDSSFFIHEGYLLYKPTDSVSVKTGRQVLSYGDELVIGALDWNNVGRSFDAVSTRASFDSLWIDGFFSKLADNNTVTNGPGDVNLYGLYGSKKWGSDAPVVLDGYFLHREDNSVTPTNYLEAAGLRSNGKWNQLDCRVEVTKEFGPFFADESSAYQLDGETGYTFENAMRPRIGAEYFYAGKTYNQLYPTSHKWLGYADVLGRANITGFVVHSKINLDEKTTLGLDGHYFSRVSQDAPVYKVNGTTALGTAAGSTSNFVGTEWDLTASHQLTKPLMVSGGLAYFNSGSYLTDQFGTLNPVFYYVQMEARF